VGAHRSGPDARAGLSVAQLVVAALAEDLGERGDVTSELLLPKDAQASAQLRSRAAGVFAGREPAQETADQLGVNAQWHLNDGANLSPGRVVAEFSGPARSVLTAERTILNFVCHLSGVATLSAAFVEAAAPAAILDTRKTTPGWRALEKAAVASGGAMNHRIGLYDRVLVKDNHLALAGASLAESVVRARQKYPDLLVEVEADDLHGVQAGLDADADWILLDNMTLGELRDSVALVDGGAKLEASGNMSLDRVSEVAATGVDAISVGALTHSAPSLDLGFDIDG